MDSYHLILFFFFLVTTTQVLLCGLKRDEQCRALNLALVGLVVMDGSH